MALKTVLKVAIWCEKCQKKLLQAVCELEGVDKIDVDAEKGLLTVIGEADPCEIIARARKACAHAEVVNIGPPPKEPEKKPEVKPPPVQSSDKCPTCQPITVIHWEQWDDPPPMMCSIL